MVVSEFSFSLIKNILKYAVDKADAKKIWWINNNLLKMMNNESVDPEFEKKFIDTF